VFETDELLAFRDIHPQAPTHVLLIPKQHMDSVHNLTASDLNLAGALLIAARDIAAAEGLDADGYRLAINAGQWGGQSVGHLHLHILGGRPLGALG
jgi:histidine triad (HIT) family protein